MPGVAERIEPIGVDPVEFTEDRLAEAISNVGFKKDRVLGLRRFDYLLGYLRRLRCQSMLIENLYSDSTYLADYIRHYVRCSTAYKRTCRRIHFFRCPLSQLERARDAAIPDESVRCAARLARDYLGFVVARPLPGRVIGRTVLRTYAPQGGKRHYCVTRPYDVHLCGLNLSITSLAFQEQDKVAAACATVALWTAFQATSKLVGHREPSLSEIGEMAERYLAGQRFVSSGLKLRQMNQAVKELGLTPKMLVATDELAFCSLVSAYLYARIPVIVNGLFIGKDSHGREVRDIHSITLVGFKKEATRQRSEEYARAAGVEGLPEMQGTRISKFYGHDDQLGPFARFAVDTDRPEFVPELETRLTVRLRSTVLRRERRREQTLFWPSEILVPLPPIIRITFFDVLPMIAGFDRMLAAILGLDSSDEDQRFSWEVHLLSTNQYKAEVRFAPEYDANDRARMLELHHPRYLWRARASIGAHPVVETLADATDLADQPLFYAITAFEESLFEKLREPLKPGEESKLLMDEYECTALAQLCQSALGYGGSDESRT